MTIDEKVKQYLERARGIMIEGDLNQSNLTDEAKLQIHANLVEVAKMIQAEEHRIKEHHYVPIIRK